MRNRLLQIYGWFYLIRYVVFVWKLLIFIYFYFLSILVVDHYAIDYGSFAMKMTILEQFFIDISSRIRFAQETMFKNEQKVRKMPENNPKQFSSKKFIEILKVRRKIKKYYQISASRGTIYKINLIFIINQQQILDQETVKMQAQNKIQNRPEVENQNKQQIEVPKDTVAMMEQNQAKKRNDQNIETENNIKLDKKYHEELSKQLEVPKDSMQMIIDKEESKKIEPEIIRINEFVQQRKQEKEAAENKQEGEKDCDKKEGCDRLSGQIEKQLSPIKQEKAAEQNGRDLLNFDVEPIRIQPKFKTRDSQQEFMKQMYQPKKDHTSQLERKQQLIPRTADRIMEQIKRDEMKDEKEQENLHKNADVRRKQKEEDLQVKQRDIKKQNERKSKRIAKQPKEDKKVVSRLSSKNADKIDVEQPSKLNKQNKIIQG